MKITKRLERVASHISKGSIVLDIGTDHGYIPVFLVKKGLSPFAIAADVNKKPLDKAKELIAENKMKDKVETRLGSGFEIIKDGEVDEVIIAGMGGVLISDLITAAGEIPKKLKKLVLQPMQAQKELRKYLLKNGYEIIEEELVKEDGRIFEIIVVEYKGQDFSDGMEEIDFEISKKHRNQNNPLFIEFLERKIHEEESILEKIKGKETKEVNEKREICKKRLEVLRGLLENEIKGNN